MTQIFFRPKKFRPTFFFGQINFYPHFFLANKNFRIFFFRPKDLLTQPFFSAKKLLTKTLFWQNFIFCQNKFLPTFLWDQTFLWQKKMSTRIVLIPNFFSYRLNWNSIKTQQPLGGFGPNFKLKLNETPLGYSNKNNYLGQSNLTQINWTCLLTWLI